MEKTGLIERLDGLFTREGGAMEAARRTVPARHLVTTRTKMLALVTNAGKSGDLDTILSVERAFLENDRDRHANSHAMAGSLDSALAELSSTERHVVLVRTPATYRAVDETHSLPKNRKGALPRDEARQFFASHAARLLNQDKSRLDPEEKQILDARKQNMRAAEKLYTGLQREALGLAATPARDRGPGMEP